MTISKDQFVEKLNEDLVLEFKSIILYTNQIASLKGAKYQQTTGELRAHLDQELNHAIIVAQQIDFLEGVPVSTMPNIEMESDPTLALEQDLKLEEMQLERYRERVQQADALGLPDVAEALSPVLEETQHHVRDLRATLGS